MSVEKILDLARWAPSGDNTQPWRFEIIDDRHLVVHGFDTRDAVVYDLRGHASQIALGALLETIEIAASSHGLCAEISRRKDASDVTPTFDIAFRESPVKPHPLLGSIKDRVTQRRPMRRRELTTSEKTELEKSVGDGFRVRWFCGDDRKKVARLLFKSAKIRLTIREAFEVHRKVIEWSSQFSDDRIPDKAVGLDPVSTRMMQWALKSWNRVRWMNRIMGTVMPRLQLDYRPGVCCAAHFIILAQARPESIDDFVNGGRATQRFWLTATRLGLQFQPEMTPLIFARYASDGVRFTSDERALQMAQAVTEGLESIAGADFASGVFMGRVGHGPTPKSRSLRIVLKDLLQT